MQAWTLATAAITSKIREAYFISSRVDNLKKEKKNGKF